jgi:hypothetical protein
LDGNGRVDLTDLKYLLGSLNDPATGPLDARDLNKNGVIDADDVRLLLGLCGSKCTLPSAPIVPDSGANCNGVYNGTFTGNLSISNGQTCTFTGGSIIGNVTQNAGTLVLEYGSGINGNLTQSGGTLVLTNTTVRGNVQITGGGKFAIGASTILGNLEIGNLVAGPGQNSVCASHVQVNLRSHDNVAPVQIGSSTATCAGNFVGGDLQVNNNTAPTTVSNNRVANNLQCQNNAAITGGGNTAQQKQGECAGF